MTLHELGNEEFYRSQGMIRRMVKSCGNDGKAKKKHGKVHNQIMFD